MPPRARPLTETDRTAWADYVRHVRTLPGRERPPIPPPPAPMPVPVPSPGHTARPAPLARSWSAVPVVTGLQPAGLDNASWGRFQGGKLPAARTLDLHGKTAQAAFNALERFLVSAHAERLRCVEVITGRGSGEHGGVIRRELPMWLNLPRFRLLVLAAAHPHAANTGSVRVLLRRTRQH